MAKQDGMCQGLLRKYTTEVPNVMNYYRRIIVLSFLAAMCLLGSGLAAFGQGRSTVSFDNDWLFSKGAAANAEQANFADSGWRKLNVPHDWSIEGPFDAKNPTIGSGGFLPSGVAWYRKHFTIPSTDRGNGWEAAGMSELLSTLPRNHPLRPRIMKGYLTMMASLLKYQGDDGLWRQLLDKPESWAESSGTGMFTFAMVTGVKKGWLPKKTYGPAARKAWLGLVNHIDENADVKDVSEGTNKGFSVQYYVDRQRKTGDLHGQVAALWSAMALMR